MAGLKTEYVALEDIRIAYCQVGRGEPLLLLHGNSISKSYFRHYQLDHFKDFHTYAIDSRGHGQSRSRDKALNYEQMSLDILTFCKALGISRTSVIGYSDGGNLALWLAVKAPEIFTKVVAISPNTVASATTDRSMASIHGFIANMTRLKRFGLPMTKQIMRFQLMLTDTGITENDLKGIRTKVQILYAERDMIKEEHFLYLSRCIPGARLEKIAECNHLNIPYQLRSIAAIRDFLIEG
jgi:pimeloyl-ACP methyl ester carboxylesterase